MPEENDVKAILKTRIGEEIYHSRVEMDLSQRAIGENRGWSRNRLSKMESGEQGPRIEDYFPIVDMLSDVLQDHPSKALKRYVSELDYPHYSDLLVDFLAILWERRKKLGFNHPAIVLCQYYLDMPARPLPENPADRGVTPRVKTSHR